MCLTGCSLCTHAAQILQLTRGPEDRAGPLGWPNHPFSDAHLSYSPHLILSKGWPCNQQRSAAQKELPAPQPSVRSRSVNQRLLIAGTLSCPGSQPSLAPSVLVLWRRRSTAKVGSHWPAALSRPYRPDLELETDPSSWSLDMVKEAWCTITVNFSEWAWYKLLLNCYQSKMQTITSAPEIQDVGLASCICRPFISSTRSTW